MARRAPAALSKNLLDYGNVRRQAQHTSNLYDYPWDPLGELAQNAVKSILKREKQD